MLSNATISDLLTFKAIKKPNEKLIDVESSTSLLNTLKILKNHNILALPVYQVEHGRKIYVGIASVGDILGWTVFQKLFDVMDQLQDMTDSNEILVKYKEMLDEEQEYFNTPISEFIGLSLESRASFSINASEPIASLQSLFATGDYHRVLVNDDRLLPATINAPIIHLVTQTDLLAFLQFSSFILTRKVGQVCSRNVLTINYKASALAGFRLMFINGINAVAVVDDDGFIIANFSVTDLRGITDGNLEILKLPIYEYLQLSHKRPDQLKPDQLRTLQETDSVGEAIETMLKCKIHRVWIVKNEEPVGVLSISDVFRIGN